MKNLLFFYGFEMYHQAYFIWVYQIILNKHTFVAIIQLYSFYPIQFHTVYAESLFKILTLW